MTELDKDLRDYVDGIAQPVTMTEVQARQRPADTPATWSRSLVAILAGAAVVLIPMLALLAITLWPSGEETADPTVTSSSTTTSTTTAAPPVGVVVVPDLIGLDEAAAIDLARKLGLEVVVTERPFDAAQAGSVVAQSPEPGAEADQASTISLAVAQAPNCDYQPTLPPLAADEDEVTVLFECGNTTTYPNVVHQTVRHVPTNDDPLAFSLRELLRGPSSDEQAAGFVSFFSDATDGALISVATNEGSEVVVDFNDAIYVGNASTSTGSVFFNAELNANVFQYPHVASVEYRINGSCEAWAEFFQSDGCWVTTREEWDRQVARWNEARAEEENRQRERADAVLPQALPEGMLISTWEGVIHSTPTETTGLFEHADPQVLEAPAIASDGDGGFYLATNGRIQHYAVGSADVIELPVHPDATPTTSSRLVILDDGDRRLLLHFAFDDEASFYGVDLATNEPWREGVSDGLAEGFMATTGNRTVFLADDEGEMITTAHYGTAANIAPDPTYLVVLEDDEVVHRLEVAKGRDDGGIHDRVIGIEDFDGRRVILSRHPGEPVGADMTFMLIDLACEGGCMQVVVDQPGSATLTGMVEIALPLGFGLDTIAACSGSPRAAEPTNEGLPPAVVAARDTWLRWAEICNVAVLNGQASTTLRWGQTFIDESTGIVGAEALSYPVLEQTIAVLTQAVPGSYADDNGITVYIWPALADPTIDWVAMTDAEATSLAAISGADAVSTVRSLGGYSGWYAEIDESGAWRFIGNNIP